MEETTNNKFFTKTFFWMFLGLLGTAIVAWYSYSSGWCERLALTGSLPIVAIIELIVVLVFSFLFKKLSPTIVGILYFVYAFLNGVTLSSVFYVYELGSIAIIFAITSALFGVLALIGYTTKKDLSNWSTILFTTLLVGIIVSIVNLFLKNNVIDVTLTWVMLVLFFGITIYDMNNLKMLSQDENLNKDKLYVYGAMQLYLDFINIFIKLLRLFGNSKD